MGKKHTQAEFAAEKKRKVKRGKTGQNYGRPTVTDPEEMMNASMMHGKKKSKPKKKY